MSDSFNPGTLGGAWRRLPYTQKQVWHLCPGYPQGDSLCGLNFSVAVAVIANHPGGVPEPRCRACMLRAVEVAWLQKLTTYDHLLMDEEVASIALGRDANS